MTRPDLSRRSALFGLSFAAPATAASASAFIPSEADPILAVIAEHRAAHDAVLGGERRRP
jgi:hypothetical protein